jgi:Zinc binding domain
MEDCCCSGEAEGTPGKCAACGALGRPVSITTLKHMVQPEFLSLVNKPGFCFCPAAGCDVVYFHPDGERLRKRDLRVRVGLKETEDPVPICYCFGFTEAMVRSEIERTGACTIPERISAEVKARHCACEVRNPQGSCCLGNVKAVVRRHMKAAGAGRPVVIA